MSALVTAGPVRVERLLEGRVWRTTIDAPKANLVDRAVARSLAEVAKAAGAERSVRAVVLEGAGANFSFGASVKEHLPAEVGEMLREFHATFRAMLASSVVWLAAVRGRCLGGGLELAAFCHRVFASPDAVLGQPEVVLGVLAPVGSAFLPERIGRPAAEDLCLTGRTVGADEALRMRLVDEVVPDPAVAALAWAEKHLCPKSAASLRCAVRAARAGWSRRFLDDLAAAERVYLEELMATKDAVEGLDAFLGKRAPVWRDE